MARPVRDLTEVASLVVADLGAAPCAVVGAAVRAKDVWQHGFGASGWLWPGTVAAAPPMATCDTIFDLASLTKSVTALTFARLERSGAVRRDEPLAALVPRLAASQSGPVALDLLMAHRAGLVAHNPFYEGLIRGERPPLEQVLLAAADMRRPECVGTPPSEGFAPVYSDLGYLLVGAALEARTGLPLDELMRREVTAFVAPSGMGSVRQLRSQPASLERFAPTEVVAWRGGLVRALVHDENAWLVAGEGTAGHAGLFGTVEAVVGLGTLVLDALAGRTTWLTARELEPLVRPRQGGSHAAGFDRRSVDAATTPASGAHFSASTFGHLGFTGTSLWIDPERELAAVLLTNRVCPTREHLAIRQARPAAYDAMFRAMIDP